MCQTFVYVHITIYLYNEGNKHIFDHFPLRAF